MTAKTPAPRTAPAHSPFAGSASGARWLVAVRLARRQVRRALVPSILISTLIMLPIATMTAYAIVTASTIASTSERATAELGRSEAWLAVAGLPGNGFWQAPTQPNFFGYPSTMSAAPTGSPVTDPTDLLPAGTATIRIVETTTRVETPDGVAGVQAWSGESWDPSLAGRFDLIDGRVPMNGSEALVTPAMLERLEIGIGDEIFLTDSGHSFTVTGTMSAASLRSVDEAVFLPASAGLDGDVKWFVPDLRLDWSDVEELNGEGIIALSRTVLDAPPDVQGTDAALAGDDYWGSRWSMIMMLGAAALFSAYVVIMLAGAAFAVSARRQQRSLAIAASVGASSADLRRVMVLQGTALGLVGGAAGLALGIGGGIVVLGLVDNGSAAEFPGLHLPWELLSAILLLAVVVGTISAAVPAHTVARTDTLSALRGARRPQLPRASRPVWGSALLLAGIAITLGAAFFAVAADAADLAWDSPARSIPPIGIVAGPIVAQLGILLSGRWLLWLAARVLSRLGLAARLASRDAAAGSSRTVPAFAAIAATVFIGVFALSAAAMQNAQMAREWYYQAPLGSMAVSFMPTGTGEVAPLDPQQKSDAAAAAVELSNAAGATQTAVIAVQPEMWPFTEVDDVPDGFTRAIAILPDEFLIDIDDSFTSFGQDPSNPISVIAVDEIETALGVTLSEAQWNAYRDGAAIVADPRFVTAGTIEVAAWSGADAFRGEMPNNIWPESANGPKWSEPVWDERIEAITVDLPQQPTTIAIAPQTAERLGLTVSPSLVIASFTTAVPLDAQDRIGAQAVALSEPDWTLLPSWETGPSDDMLWMVPIIAAVATLVLGASAVALSLARVERRPDDATLSAVGGSSGLRRRIGFWQGLIIAGFGTLAGAAAGVLPPIGLAIQSLGTLRIDDVPWVVLAALVIVLPLGIALVSWFVPPRRTDLTRRTVIA